MSKKRKDPPITLDGPSEPLVDFKTMAREIGFGAKTAYRLVKEGKIRGVKIDKRYRFDLRAVRRQLATRPTDD